MTYAFTLHLDGVSKVSDEVADRLFETGCDDGLFFARDGLASIGFDREAISLEAAIASAIANVRAAGLVVKRVELEPDDVPATVATA